MPWRGALYFLTMLTNCYDKLSTLHAFSFVHNQAHLYYPEAMIAIIPYLLLKGRTLTATFTDAMLTGLDYRILFYLANTITTK